MYLNAYIVDDEQQVRETLSAMLHEFCREVKVMGMAAGIGEALEALNNQKIDVLFLDINLGNETTGFDLLDSLRNKYDFEIVLVTASDEHALRSYDYDVTQYLLKPVSYVKLINTISKIKSKKRTVPAEPGSSGTIRHSDDSGKHYITLSDVNKTELINTDDIIYIEGKGSYCTFYLEGDASNTQSRHLKYFETQLAAYPHFIRVHKSYIVNKNYIKSYLKDTLELQLKNGVFIPTTLTHKAFMDFF